MSALTEHGVQFNKWNKKKEQKMMYKQTPTTETANEYEKRERKTNERRTKMNMKPKKPSI